MGLLRKNPSGTWGPLLSNSKDVVLARCQLWTPEELTSMTRSGNGQGKFFIRAQGSENPKIVGFLWLGTEELCGDFYLQGILKMPQAGKEKALRVLTLTITNLGDGFCAIPPSAGLVRGSTA